MVASGAVLTRPLVARRKALARVLLYLVPILLLAGGLYAWSRIPRGTVFESSWYYEDYEAMDSVQRLQAYLRIDTSYPDGNEIPGAELLAKWLEEEGLEPHVERLGSRNANVWAFVEGDVRDAVVLHNHIDVDPVPDPESWSRPPFSGRLDGPFIFGRGAFDMKSVAIAQLLATFDVAAGPTPSRSLLFLATGDEERWSRLGTQWILREHPDLVERMEVVLTEGGAVETTDGEDFVVKYWGTEFAQKRFVELMLCDSRRERLVELRDQLIGDSRDAHRHLLTPQAIQLPEPTRIFFEAYAPSRTSDVFASYLSDPSTLSGPAEVAQLPAYLRALLRNELVAFPVEEAPGGGWQLRILLHLLPGVSFEQAWDELVPPGILSDLASSVWIPHADSGWSPVDHSAFQAVEAVLGDRYPDAAHGPLFLGWTATDARYFRAAGIPAYGFSPFPIVTTDSLSIKGRDERIGLPGYVAGIEIYRDLVRRLVDRPPEDGDPG